jgi:cytochrome c oxidase subunit III
VTETEMTMAMGHGAVAEDSPFRIESKKLVMWLFIVADAATFGAILFGYGYLRVGSPNWTRPFAFIPSILNGIVMTVVLLSSSLTMLAAARAAREGRRRECIRWLAITAGLGALFAVLHLREWFGLIAEGWSPSHNPMGGPALVGGTFFGITGLHLLHVVIGVVALATVTLAFGRGRLQASHIETTGLYWHFVDLVWMFVFPLVYLMNAR